MRRIGFLPLALVLGCSLVTPAPAAPAPEPRQAVPGPLADVVYVGVATSARDFAHTRIGAIRPDGSFGELDLDVWQTKVAPDAAAAFSAHVLNDGRASIQRSDLRTGQVTLRIDMPSAAPTPSETGGTPFAVSPDGATVVLGRYTSAGGTEVRFDAVDGERGTALGSVVLRVQDATRAWASLDAPLRDRVVARLMADKDGRATGIEWLALDRELRVLRRHTGEAIPRQLSWPTSCWQPYRELPGGRELVTLCGEVFVRWLQLVDRATLAATARVDLPSSLEFADTIGWHVAPNGLVTVLTGRPAVIRVDAARHRLVDTRVVPTEKSLLDLFAPPVALAKILVHPDLQFSTDGRRAYVAQMAVDIPHFWRDGVVAIDISSATIAWRALAGEDVRGIHLSPDGGRLYVLLSEKKETPLPEARIVTLDSRDGTVFWRSEILPRPAFQIVTVARP